MAIKINNTTVIDDSRNIQNIGIITATTINATSFVGNGSGLTGAGSTVADDTSTNSTFYPVLTQTTTGTITSSNVSTTKLSFNPSTGTLSATGVSATAERTTWSQVGSGLTFTTGIATNFTVSGVGTITQLVSTNVNVSGVSSVGSGITLTSTGDIRFAGIITGRGSGLSGVTTTLVASVGVQSAGAIIGAGITQLNFIGAGNTFAVRGTTVDISIAGGGGSLEVRQAGSNVGYSVTVLNFQTGSGISAAAGIATVNSRFNRVNYIFN
jgi:hypothetical protein